MQRRFHTHRPQGDTFPSEPFEPFEPSEPRPLRGPIVISSGVEKSPGTMLPVVGRGYVSRHNVRLLPKEGAGRSPEDRSENLRRDLTPLSSVACGDTPLPKEGGYGSPSSTTGDTKVNPVTQAPSPGRSWAEP